MTIKTITVVEKELKLKVLGKLLEDAKNVAERDDIDTSTYEYLINEFDLDIDELLVRLFTERVTFEIVEDRIKKAYGKEIGAQIYPLDLSEEMNVVGIIKTLEKFIDDLEK